MVTEANNLMKIDATDIKILNILQRQGRITNTALAKEIEISPPPTLERVKKLEKNGVIGPHNSSKSREVLISIDEWEKSRELRKSA